MNHLPLLSAACFAISISSAGAQNLAALPAPVALSCAAAPANVRVFCDQGLDIASRQIVAARRGDYDAMRNVAFCLADGCDGSVVRNREASCAWRRAIIQRHGRAGGKAGRSDEMNMATCVQWGY
jgi:hypothetical protein